jgi:hypothetical protein
MLVRLVRQCITVYMYLYIYIDIYITCIHIIYIYTHISPYILCLHIRGVSSEAPREAMDYHIIHSVLNCLVRQYNAE